MIEKRIMKYNKPGFVLISVMILLSIASLMVVQLATRSTVYNMFVPIVSEQEQARALALSGISCAINKLALKDTSILGKKDEKKDTEKKEKEDPKERMQDLMMTLLLTLNKWHNYSIKTDDIEGTLGIYITCEDGKIPLNYLMDFEKKEFITLEKPTLVKSKDALEYISQKLEDVTKAKNVFPDLEKALKDRSYAFTSVEELLSLKSMHPLKNYLYVSFPSDVDQHTYALTDIFSTCSTTSTINPWLFSSSVKILYDIKNEEKKDKKELQELVKGIDFSVIALSQEWDKNLKKLYNKSYTALPDKIVGLLSGYFEPRFFCVLCYGKIGSIEQRLCAYIERSFKDDTETFKVQKIYWL